MNLDNWSYGVKTLQQEHRVLLSPPTFIHIHLHSGLTSTGNNVWLHENSSVQSQQLHFSTNMRQSTSMMCRINQMKMTRPSQVFLITHISAGVASRRPLCSNMALVSLASLLSTTRDISTLMRRAWMRSGLSDKWIFFSGGGNLRNTLKASE